MLVVVSIIGLMAGISYPSVAAGLDSVRMRSATDSVSTILNSAVDHAERRQQPVEIVIAPKENTISLLSTDPGFHRQLKLPAPGIGVQLVNRHGARRLVRLDPMTGFPRVESVSGK